LWSTRQLHGDGRRRRLVSHATSLDHIGEQRKTGANGDGDWQNDCAEYNGLGEQYFGLP